MSQSAYTKLEDRFHRLALLHEAGHILDWDSATIMPNGAAAARGEQVAELKALSHGILAATETGDLIEAATEQVDLNPWQRSNLDLIRRQWTRATVLPEDLVVALSKACSESETVWREARAEADFEKIRPYTETVLSLVRESATAVAEKLDLSLYDALLDQFEPGARSAEIDPVFDDLGKWLPGFLNEVLAAQERRPAIEMPQGPFPVATQRELGVKFMAALGFDFDYGRLDISLHPFCGGTPDDVRITTRYDEADFTSALMGVLHETGHAMYERGLPQDYRRKPVGLALGMSMHEGQSLLVEMQVCRSRGFLEYAAPLVRQAFNGSGPAWEVDNLHRLYSKVERGFIRVDADEVTYPAHVILRYELEKALIHDEMRLADLPEAWNQRMGDLLGITPANDREGCLQDIHWYDGAWGYFPTYTLGAMTAAQVFRAATDADPAISAGIPQGDFKPLMGWLRENIHAKGSLMPASQLLTEATGHALDPEIFKDHLRQRYLN
ncbi:MAG: carboxypeptidase M32 [Rhodospirillales bacterium]|nr:carboxypeptidase M32 [Rhodospirillales bacterium]